MGVSIFPAASAGGTTSQLPPGASTVLIDGLLVSDTVTVQLAIAAGSYYVSSGQSITLTTNSGYTVKTTAGSTSILNVLTSQTSVTITASQPGEVWLAGTLPYSVNWTAVAYGGGKYVAIAGNGSSDKAAYSTDGITWTGYTLPVSYYWQSIAYGASGRFVLVPNGTTTMYSSDGITWTIGGNIAAANWYCLTYSPSGWFAANSISNGTVAASSVLGSSWDARTQISMNCYQSAADTNGGNVSVVSSSTNGQYTANGATYYAVTYPAAFNSVTFGGTKFVYTVGGITNTLYSATSVGGGWTLSTLPATLSWKGSMYINGTWVVFASNSAITATSGDLITWTLSNLPSTWTGSKSQNGIGGSGTGVLLGTANNVVHTTGILARPGGVSFGAYAGPTTTSY